MHEKGPSFESFAKLGLAQSSDFSRDDIFNARHSVHNQAKAFVPADDAGDDAAGEFKALVLRQGHDRFSNLLGAHGNKLLDRERANKLIVTCSTEV
jgi:hypothetical protein